VENGLELAEAFYREIVADIVESHVAPSGYSAALIGPGSEVLGYDDARSTDHDWGPRLQLLLSDATGTADLEALHADLDQRLPDTFRSRAVRFPLSREPQRRHRVEVTTSAAWFRAQIGFDPSHGIELVDWLAVPMARLAEVTGGRVFHDGPGVVGRSRSALAWYPDDVWRWVLAAQWRRIAQEEAFPGRCAERGDMLGASVVVARLIRDIMRLWLLMARVYPPYAKWLGTAFARLPDSDLVIGDLKRAAAAPDWPTQQRHLGAALVATARRQNDLKLAERCPSTLQPFHDRPYLVVGGDRFAAALLARVEDPRLRAVPLTGVCDQYLDSTDAVGRLDFVRAATTALLAATDGPTLDGWT
jgi:hypothetical protein